MKKSFTMKFGSLIAALLLVTPLGLFAQGFQVGAIQGIVTDETGGSLPGVTVTATSVDRGSTRTEMTDSNGRYRFAALALGQYTVEATLSGFQTATRRQVLVQAETTNTTNITLRLAAETAEITVTAESPIVDPTNATQTTRVSTEEYEKAPIGRSYQTLARLAPGVVGGSNPNSSGALSSNNQYLFDGIDATDPTTGTFGANLNFEAIQEVNILTNGISAEYGRASGAIVSVITKSGTNELEGSLKAIGTNDDWNGQNTTKHSITGTSFEREKQDQLDSRYAGTLGGPIWRDRAWFFGAYEEWNQKGAALRTTAVTNEEWSEARNLELHNYRITAQLTPSHQLWAKYAEDPFTGIVVAYGGGNGDLYTLTLQGQGGDNRAIQYAGVIGSRLSLEAMYAEATSTITVEPFRAPGPFDNGSAVWDLSRNRYLNGFYFGKGDNVSRPRDQINAAATYFATLGQNTHDLKLGVDLQDFESLSRYTYTNNRLYEVFFDPVTYDFDKTRTGQFRYDFADLGPQNSTGGVDSIYLRDKFTVGPRINIEAGVRYEDQFGKNDVGTPVVDSQVLSPRLSGTYDLTGDGRTLLTATAGRFHDFILQTFTDGYAQTRQRAVYDIFEWNVATQSWVFIDAINPTSGGIDPNLDLNPSYTDEVTLGFQRQLGATMGVGVRGVWREWDDLIDDFRRYVGGTVEVDYENSSLAKRSYQGIQTTFEKRFANNWSMLANYTYSKAEGNHFSNATSGVNNFANAMCRGHLDASIGTIPCQQAIDNLSGRATYDYPHFLNVLGTYSRPVGPVNLSMGVAGNYQSGQNYSKIGSVRVLNDAGGDTSQTMTYYYDGFNSERLDNIWSLDTALEATYRLFSDVELGLKGEVFNVTDNQDPVSVSLQTWCNADTAACATTRANHGARTARGSFQSPRNFRITGLIRF
ncbi:MAG TPA: TonB-dependent receptor [Thermoanaerobaculia bacterium]|nr:TonB-dependent receptor [Thermoanaerobaculia bacterium]